MSRIISIQITVEEAPSSRYSMSGAELASTTYRVSEELFEAGAVARAIVEGAELLLRQTVIRSVPVADDLDDILAVGPAL